MLVASTGVIGMQLPMDRITAGVKALAGTLSDTVDAGREAAEAIMTTDTHSKQVAVTIELSGKTVTIGGMAKGSGTVSYTHLDVYKRQVVKEAMDSLYRE